MKILIMSQKGGVGKSTIAFNLAKNLSKYSKVLLIDCDNQGSLIGLKKTIEDTTNITVVKLEDVISEKVDMNQFDKIVIDTPPYQSKEIGSVIEFADLIIVPSKTSILDLNSVMKSNDLINKYGGKNKKRYLLFNMINKSSTLLDEATEMVKDNNDFELLNTNIPELVSLTRSLYQDLDKKSQIKMNDLTIEILSK